jgi:hypothetical protein
MPNDFAVIKDGVDTSLEIIVHKTTGFFNITKIAALVKRLKTEEQVNSDDIQPDGIPSGSFKQPRVWFTNDTTQRLISSILRYNPDVYDHFMMWFDAEYAIRVSGLLKRHRIAAQIEDANHYITRSILEVYNAPIHLM